MIPIYLAAPWVDREYAKSVSTTLVSAGFSITEPWWDHPDTTNNEELQEQAWKDFLGVISADCVIVLNTSKSEGKAVETGLALARKIPVIVVGEPTNIFHHLPEIVIVSSVEDAIEHIRGEGQRS